MKLVIMQFSPTPCHLIPLLSKYSPQHPISNTLNLSGSGFPSNATLVWIFYSVTATCFGLMTIGYWIKYSNQCCVIRKPWTWPSTRNRMQTTNFKTLHLCSSLNVTDPWHILWLRKQPLDTEQLRIPTRGGPPVGNLGVGPRLLTK
jgi:hypothetical protein